MKIDFDKIKGYCKNNKKTVAAVCVLAVSLLVIAFFGKITYESGDDDFTVGAWLTSKTTISYKSVSSVSNVEEFDVGRRKTGMETGRVYAGTFENGKYGVYRLYIYNSVASYIVVTSDEGTMVFNCSSAEKTEDAFRELIMKTSPYKDK